MRHSITFTFASLVASTGCSTYSATQVVVNDAGADTGGQSSTGGIASTGGAASGGSSSIAGTNTGGSSNQAGTGGAMTAIGGSAATGGAAPSSGGSTTTGTVTTVGGISAGGASTSAGGKSTTGGTSVTTGGASITGGTSAAGGASSTGCTKDADCVNVDPTNCSYTCINPGASGTCKPTATLTPTQCATTACDDRAISGYWDASGKPHIAYAFTETDGSATIRMQQVKADGTADGASTAFKLATDQLAPKLLSANAIGSKVGLLYQTRVLGQQASYTDYDKFVITDVTGAASTPAELANSGNSGGTGWVRLDVTPSGAWLGLGRYGSPAVEYWTATSGSNLGPWTVLDPPLYEGQFAASVVENTLMVTGASCNTRYTCAATLNLQRFSAASLSSLGSPITLSQSFSTAVTATAAMGMIGAQVAVLWNEFASPGQLNSTLINADGSVGRSLGTVQSAVSPRTILQSSSGGALLIGVITTGFTYQLVGQRLDSNLGLLGNPLPIAAFQSADAANIEVHPSTDGSQVLVTYRQAGARYRVLGTNLCGG